MQRKLRVLPLAAVIFLTVSGGLDMPAGIQARTPDIALTIAPA